MPLARYLFYCGGVLLALLFIADAYLPKLPVAARAGTHLPAIRIHTERKWPARVVFDTNLPAIIPAQIAKTDASAPARVGNVSVNTRVREAFAQMQATDLRQSQQPEARKTEPKPQRQRKVAKRRAPPPMILVARQPQFGWSGRNIW